MEAQRRIYKNIEETKEEWFLLKKFSLMKEAKEKAENYRGSDLYLFNNQVLYYENLYEIFRSTSNKPYITTPDGKFQVFIEVGKGEILYHLLHEGEEIERGTICSRVPNYHIDQYDLNDYIFYWRRSPRRVVIEKMKDLGFLGS